MRTENSPMSEKQVTNNKEKNIGPVEAYNILLQRHINEDRIVAMTLTIFLAATSILFLSFVMLDTTFRVLRITLSILGMFFTFWMYHRNLSAANALRFWTRAQQKLEQEDPTFSYMRDKKITPHLDGYQAIRGYQELKQVDGQWSWQPLRKPWSWVNKPLHLSWLRHMYELYLPIAFFVLWAVALIVAIIN